MVAGGSVLAAAHGILGRAWTESCHLVTKLQQITSVDGVRYVTLSITCICMRNLGILLDCSAALDVQSKAVFCTFSFLQVV